LLFDITPDYAAIRRYAIILLRASAPVPRGARVAGMLFYAEPNQ
jgi:hypothetical protein